MPLSAFLPAAALGVAGLAGGVIAGLWPPAHGPVAVLPAAFAAAVTAVEPAGGQVTAAAALPGLVVAQPANGDDDATFRAGLRAAGGVLLLDPAGLAGCAPPVP
ncbi:hypothetical protein [Caenispirillum bisanense]|uniref:hypothetical protein n=1 Tax=Caenispirillum bisanense TaxID=414052 RepID=UPI0031DDF364